jgi:hypothetical protein
MDYYGFTLERETEPIEEFSPELADRARRALAEAMARGEARHPGARANQQAIEEIRETYRRSGGQTPRFGFQDLAALYEQQLAGVQSMAQFRHTPLVVDADAIVPREVRERYASLPTTATLRDREVEIQYDVEESADGSTRVGVARLRLPEKMARTLTEAELPTLDRPLRFIVTRGARGAARANTLDELQEELDRPFTAAEIEQLEREHDRRREEKRELRHKRHGRGGDKPGPPRGRGGHRRRRRG